ncbi:hypothetical protein EMPS_06291 [Entomortierella parvispora]|uniref:O-fucosyltransferase family protein n=1 Tax=Entomortierella parvispora TaxID=205924 RepID=A0A9P3HCF1_9FUNG|nr:hypothetical protein EMPS_06291 [Entomortierella parvispora]
MAKPANGQGKTDFRARNRVLFIGLVFCVLFFLFAVQVEWVPYLNSSSVSLPNAASSSKNKPVPPARTNPGDNEKSTLPPPTTDSNSDDQDQNSTDGQDSDEVLDLTTKPTEERPSQLEGNKEHNPFLTMFPSRAPAEGERFLGYLPHSGFHNQLMTLENSLRLAAYLNRTLLLPPLHLSHKKEALYWKEPAHLLNQWRQRTRIGSEYCRDRVDPLTLPPKTEEELKAMTQEELKQEQECHFYYSWTTVPWTYFYDIPQILSGAVGVGQQTEPIRVFDRPNMTMEWLSEHLDIKDAKKEIFFFEDTNRYEFKIMDDSEVDYSVKPVKPLEPEVDLSTLEPSVVKWMERYTHSLLLTDLQRRPERVLHFGSLFATDRVEARSEGHKALKSFISKGMDLWNDGILEATELAEAQIEAWIKETQRAAPGFLGAHLRTEDGQFEKQVQKNLQRIVAWLGEMVKKDRKYLTANEIDATKDKEDDKDAAPKRQLETRGEPLDNTTTTSTPTADSKTQNTETGTQGDQSTTTPSPADPKTLKDTDTTTQVEQTTPTSEQAPKAQTRTFVERCKEAPPESPLVFLATDVHQPRESNLLAEYLDQFPCTMFLTDFKASLAVLEEIKNPTDGMSMFQYLVALMDANLAAKGRMFQGTERSTFSAYITNHLWPEYHSSELDEDLSE